MQKDTFPVLLVSLYLREHDTTVDWLITCPHNTPLMFVRGFVTVDLGVVHG